MTILNDKAKTEVRDIFKDLKDPVTLMVFSRDDKIAIPGHECPSCRDNETLLKEVSSLSDKITLTVLDKVKDSEKAAEYGIDKIPATIVMGTKDPGIRLYGIPAGQEFSTLLNAISIVSTYESGLTQETKEKLRSLVKPVHIQVFVTLTCPYCAPAAMLAHRMALECDLIRADMVNAQEFPHVSQRYSVYAVPKIVINEIIQFEGAPDESTLLDKIMAAVSLPQDSITMKGTDDDARTT